MIQPLCTSIYRGMLLWLMFLPAAHAGAFTRCADAAELPDLADSLCARLSVPLSYGAGPSAIRDEQIELFVRRFPASGESKGEVWLIAGGPGESGASLYPLISTLRRSFPRFDLIIPDHRGTGYSERLCPQEEAADSPAGMAVSGPEWQTCAKWLNEHADATQQFSITNAARDLKTLLETLHSGGRVYVYAVSYGTQLVLRMLQLGELHLDGLVLDSIIPLETDRQWDLSRRSHIVDDVGRKVLAHCDADRRCHGMVGQPLESVYRRLLAQAADQPQLLSKIPGGDLKLFFGSLLDVPQHVHLPSVITQMARGQSGALETALAELNNVTELMTRRYPQSSPSIPLVQIISTSENTLRPGLTTQQVTQLEQEMLFSSIIPRLLVDPWLPLYERDAYFGHHPKQLPPTLILHGTLDPKTHYSGALAHVSALKRLGSVSLISVTNAPHFILWSAPECFQRHVRAFVTGHAVPDQSCAAH